MKLTTQQPDVTTIGLPNMHVFSGSQDYLKTLQLLNLTAEEQAELLSYMRNLQASESWNDFLLSAACIKLLYPDLFPQLGIDESIRIKLREWFRYLGILYGDNNTVFKPDNVWFFYAILFPSSFQLFTLDPYLKTSLARDLDINNPASLMTYIAFLIAHGYTPTDETRRKVADEFKYKSESSFVEDTLVALNTLPRLLMGDYWQVDHVPTMTEEWITCVNRLKIDRQEFMLFLLKALFMLLATSPQIEMNRGEIYLMIEAIDDGMQPLPNVLTY